MRRIIMVALIVGALACAGVWYAYAQRASNAAWSYAKEKEDVESLFSGKNPREAFAAFKKMNERASQATQHINAHVFGEVLYEKEGVGALTACGSDFGFGCFHSFIGQAIAEGGTAIVPRLDAACVAIGPMALGCFHGLGHGLLAYFGYESKGLAKSLDTCATLSWHHRYGGCVDGVFMEYNLRTMLAQDGRIRPFTDEKHMEPCASLKAAFQPACYFSLPEWWRESLAGDTDAPAKMGAYCGSLSEGENRAACFRGIGYSQSFPHSFQADSGVEFCGQYASMGATDALRCKEGYAWALYANGDHAGAESVCTRGASAGDSKRCFDEYLFVLK